MRIAYISENYQPSIAANSTQTLQMAAALGALGHKVEVLSPNHPSAVREARFARLCEDYSLEPTFLLRYLPHLRLANGRFGGSFGLLATFLARAENFDLVFTRNVRIASAAARLGCRVVQESHSPHGSAESERQHKAALRLARSPSLKRWVFISKRLMDLVREDVPIPGPLCVVAHDAVDLARFSPGMARDEARAKLGLALPRPLVVHSGHLYPGRGADLLVQVAQRLPQADFVFVGGASHDIARIQAEAKKLKLSNVRLVGHLRLPDIPPYLFAANVLVMPYTSNTVTSDRKTHTIEYASPMKLFEYMAAGRGIVATRFPAILEVLKDGTNARIVEADSVEALYNGILDLVSNPSASDLLGAQARADVSSHTWEGRARTILQGLEIS
ncbi:MAG: glycosyltransferase family 4 protein [Polyangiaceae bacterium]|nr:glycosyltransferase family 4 protein [Polyangiaceae bacterium]